MDTIVHYCIGRSTLCGDKEGKCTTIKIFVTCKECLRKIRSFTY